MGTYSFCSLKNFIPRAGTVTLFVTSLLVTIAEELPHDAGELTSKLPAKQILRSQQLPRK
jgi:hypothetical protein